MSDHGTPGRWASREPVDHARRPRPPRRGKLRTCGHGPSGRLGLQRRGLHRAVGQHGVGDGEDLRGGAVVVVEAHDLGAGEAALEADEVARRRRRSTRRWPGWGRRRRTGRRRSPSQPSSRRNWTGLTSWNSSTNRWRKRQRCAAANDSSPSMARASRTAGRRSRPGPGRPSPSRSGGRGRPPRSSGRGASRPALAACYRVGRRVIIRALAHSISPATSAGFDCRRRVQQQRTRMRTLRSSSAGLGLAAVGPAPAQLRVGDGVEGARRRPAAARRARRSRAGELARRLAGEGEGEHVVGAGGAARRCGGRCAG